MDLRKRRCSTDDRRYCAFEFRLFSLLILQGLFVAEALKKVIFCEALSLTGQKDSIFGPVIVIIE